jgi:hypothetical protein
MVPETYAIDGIGAIGAEGYARPNVKLDGYALTHRPVFITGDGRL